MGIRFSLSCSTMTKLFVLFSALAVLVTGKPSEQISLKSKTIQDVTSSSAPAYWTAECGDRTYVGTYTLMMDWAECRDYCQYFPHAGELGHSFTFADILDTDTMECLRYNMNQQYTPGNGYAGHYWAGGYRGEDGQYRWDSGEPFDFHDFIGNPGDEQYIHLTPGNNYQWNLKSDQNDQNNGCICKSEQSATEKKITGSECPVGWIDIGPYCIYLVPQRMNHDNYSIPEARSICQGFGGDLISWFDKSEYMPLYIWTQEMCLDPQHDYDCSDYWTNANALVITGVFMWGDGPELVATEYWDHNEPNEEGPCTCLRAKTGKLVDTNCGFYFYPLCQIRK